MKKLKIIPLFFVLLLSQKLLLSESLAEQWYSEQITNNQTSSYSPRINNNGAMAWMNLADYGDNYGAVFYRKDGTTTQITPDYIRRNGVSLNDNGLILWSDLNGSYYQIYSYLDNPIRKLTTDPSHHIYPDSNDIGQMVWTGYGGDQNVFLDGVPITAGAKERMYASINNGRDLVWQETINGYKQIVLQKDGVTPVKSVTGGNTDHLQPSLNNKDQIVWIEKIKHRDGNSYTQVMLKKEEGVVKQITWEPANHAFPSLNDRGDLVYTQTIDGVNQVMKESYVGDRNYRGGMILAKTSDSLMDAKKITADYERNADKITDYFWQQSNGSVGVKYYMVHELDAENDTTWYEVGKKEEDYSRSNLSNLLNDPRATFISDAKKAVEDDQYLDQFDLRMVIRSGQETNADTGRDGAVAAPDVGHKSNDIYLYEKSEIGTYLHETAHILGKFEGHKEMLPDLYKMGNMQPDGSTRLYARFDLMAGGSKVGFGVHPTQLSSFSKERLGWLKYEPFRLGAWESRWDSNNPLQLKSLGTMELNKDFIPQLWLSDNRYYIVELRKTTDPEDEYLYSDAPDRVGFKQGIVLYEVNKRSEPLYDSDFKYNWALNLKGIVSNHGEVGEDWVYVNNKARVTTLSPVFDKAQDSIVGVTIESKDYSTTGPFCGMFLIYSPQGVPASFNDDDIGPLPDLDLHMYMEDGLHIGLNPNTGIFENQVSGAKASGPLYGSDEWILLPAGTTGYRFVVDSWQYQEFLKLHPELEGFDSTISYSLVGLYNDPESKKIYTSNVMNGQILAGTSTEWILEYLKNADGSFSVNVVVTPEPASMLLFGLGGAAMAFARRRMKV